MVWSCKNDDASLYGLLRLLLDYIGLSAWRNAKTVEVELLSGMFDAWMPAVHAAAAAAALALLALTRVIFSRLLA